MPDIDWPAFFREAPFPHDPVDYLVAADYYAERGSSVEDAYRTAAKFWAWVRRRRFLPEDRWRGSSRAPEQRWAWGTGYKGRGGLPKYVFLALPDDPDGLMASRAVVANLVLWWPSENEAWNALLTAWLKTRGRRKDD